MSWVKMGQKLAQLALTSGANDFGGTLMEESISRESGADHGENLPAETMRRLIREMGRAPVERSTTYRVLRRFDDPALDPPSLEPSQQRRAQRPSSLPRGAGSGAGSRSAGRPFGVGRRSLPAAFEPRGQLLDLIAERRALEDRPLDALDRVRDRGVVAPERRGRSRTSSRPCSGGTGTSRAAAGAASARRASARRAASASRRRSRRRRRPRPRASGAPAPARRACAAPPRPARGRSCGRAARRSPRAGSARPRGRARCRARCRRAARGSPAAARCRRARPCRAGSRGAASRSGSSISATSPPDICDASRGESDGMRRGSRSPVSTTRAPARRRCSTMWSSSSCVASLPARNCTSSSTSRSHSWR